jgi:polar amino acid transport system substrate-binding protein
MRRLSALLAAGALVAGLAACGDDDDTAGTSGPTGTAAAPTATGTATTGGAPGTTAGAPGTTAGAPGTTATAGSAVEAEFTPVTPGTLTVVTSLPAPGFWQGTDPDKITGGYEYEIAKALQERLGMANLKIVNVSFDQLVAGQVGDFDVALSQVTITDERKQVVDFTEPYFESDQGVIVKSGTEVANMDQARALQWGVQSGTTGAQYLADEVKPEKEAQVFQDLSVGFAALEAGQVDAFMMDTAIVLAQAAESNGSEEVVAQFKTGEEYGGILPKGSTNADAINAVLTELKDDGSLGQFAEQWLGGDPSTVPVLTP